MTVTHLPDLALNPAAQMTRIPVGLEQQNVLIIDDVVKAPQALVDYACTQTFVTPAEGSYYPGLNARLPDNYLPLLISGLRPLIARLYGVAPSVNLPAFGFFGLATRPQTAPDPLQIIPHIDSPKLNSFAAVHYLGNPAFGGTGLFRHVATGVETVPPSRNYSFNRQMKAELAERQAEGLCDAAGLSGLYEQIEYIEPVFNRLVLYKANQLHSAVLKNTETLVSDPRQGRLTANTFINTLQG